MLIVIVNIKLIVIWGGGWDYGVWFDGYVGLYVESFSIGIMFELVFSFCFG